MRIIDRRTHVAIIYWWASAADATKKRKMINAKSPRPSRSTTVAHTFSVSCCCWQFCDDNSSQLFGTRFLLFFYTEEEEKVGDDRRGKCRRPWSRLSFIFLFSRAGHLHQNLRGKVLGNESTDRISTHHRCVSPSQIWRQCRDVQLFIIWLYYYYIYCSYIPRNLLV